MMLRVLLDLAVGFVVESVVGSSIQGWDFQREMHRYLDERTLPAPATVRRRP